MASSARIDELRKKFDENPRRYFAPLANEYRKLGDLEQAIFICQEYLPQQPGHMSGHIVYGQALYESGRAEEANVVFETALALDPENLIALKHLGDIARQAGDLDTARIWYQRVLEADPRNEEIAQLMISLLATPDAPPATLAVHTPPLSREPLRPTPAAAQGAAHDPTSTGQSAASAPGENSGLVVEKSESGPVDLAAPVTPGEVEPPPPPPPHTTAATTAGDGHAFLDLADFNIGGIASTPDARDEAFGVDDRQPDRAPDDAVSEGANADGFDLGAGDDAFEADPYAIAAAPPAPDIELASDLRIGLPSEDPPQVEGLDWSAPTEPLESSDAAALEGLETFEPGAIGSIANAEWPARSEEFAEASPSEVAASPVEQSSSDANTEDGAASPRGFVTETMAELYLRQGHLDLALDIYRQLAEQRPDDVLLLDRLQYVEEQVHGAAADPAASSASDAPAVTAYGGPTIREFLSNLAVRRASPFPPAATGASEGDSDAHSEDDFDSAASPVHDAAADESASQTTSDAVNSSVSGSIDALFSGAEASAQDAAAASTLQDAFADGSPTAPLRGKPAHTASSELSLDHVFKGNAPPPPDNDGFSFDQFFAEEMTESTTKPNTEGAAPSQPADDIAQFNAWLNGLKKT